MNCQQCLEELATGSLRDLTPDSAISRHAATCPDCGPLLTQLRDREYQAATILNSLPPVSDPIVVAETAGRLAQRRRVGRVVVTLTSIALGLSIWFAAHTFFPGVFEAGHGTGGLQTEIIPLSCLSPEQAGDLINPYVRGPGRIYYTAPGVSSITVRASPSEIWQIRGVLHDFDSPRTSSCHIGAQINAAELQRQLQGAAALSDLQKQLEKITEVQGERLQQGERLERPARPDARGPTKPPPAGAKPNPSKNPTP
jgi:hypothetical protein